MTEAKVRNGMSRHYKKDAPSKNWRGRSKNKMREKHSQDELRSHWTEENGAFRHFILDDYIDAIKDRLESIGMSQSKFAEKIGVTEGRVSQILNNPQNVTMENLIRWSRALGMKVSILCYGDGDQHNRLGPIPADIFLKCWMHLGNPKNYKELKERGIAVDTDEEGFQCD